MDERLEEFKRQLGIQHPQDEDAEEQVDCESQASSHRASLPGSRPVSIFGDTVIGDNAKFERNFSIEFYSGTPSSHEFESITNQSARYRQRIIRGIEHWAVPSIDGNQKFYHDGRDRISSFAELTIVDAKAIDKAIAAEPRKNAGNKQDDATGDRIKVQDIVQESSTRRFIRGIAGIGKTSLAEFMLLSWALGNLFNDLFDFVFLVKCSELGIWKDEKISEFFNQVYGIIPESLMDFGHKVLIIIDGLDEIADLKGELKRNTILRQLLHISGGFMNGKSIIVTGRPHTEVIFKANGQLTGTFTTLEITGLEEPAIAAHIKRFAAGNEVLEKRITDAIHSSDNAQILSRIPQYLNSICCIVAIEEKEVAINKKTALFVWVFASFLRQHVKACNDRNKIREIFDDPIITRFIQTLSEISYTLLIRDTNAFREKEFPTFDDIVRNNKEIKDKLDVFIVEKAIGQKTYYQFRHHSLQQFFAAIRCAQDESISVANLMDRGLFEVVEFVCGFAAAVVESVDEDDTVRSFVNQIFSLRLDHNKNAKLRTREDLDYQISSYLDQNARKLGNFAHRFALQSLDELFESGAQVDQGRGNSLLEMASRLYKDFSGDSSFYYNPMTEGNSQQLSHYIRMKEANDTAQELSKMILFITDSKLMASQGNEDLFDELHHFNGVAFKSCPTIDKDLWLKLKSSLNFNLSSLKNIWLTNCTLEENEIMALMEVVPFVPEVAIEGTQLDDTSCDRLVECIRTERAKGAIRLTNIRLWECYISQDRHQMFMKELKGIKLDILDDFLYIDENIELPF
eukprot:Seg3186.7 transcript_id=Seg3186.7/GoldUCD/mRNA.D3Y31 product="NACHT LRR and PYD domains-containing protein 1b allele 5" protein_id=Seg3186.7/GoldUCD/D3Y31